MIDIGKVLDLARAQYDRGCFQDAQKCCRDILAEYPQHATARQIFLDAYDAFLAEMTVRSESAADYIIWSEHRHSSPTYSAIGDFPNGH